MALEQMSSRDHAVIKGCLDAVISEIFIDAGEFEAVSGADLGTPGDVAAAFPHVHDSRDAVELAIHGALLVLQFSPHRQENRWSDFVPASFPEVTAVHQRWMVLKGWAVPDLDPPGRYFFDLLR